MDVIYSFRPKMLEKMSQHKLMYLVQMLNKYINFCWSIFAYMLGQREYLHLRFCIF